MKCRYQMRPERGNFIEPVYRVSIGKDKSSRLKDKTLLCDGRTRRPVPLILVLTSLDKDARPCACAKAATTEAGQSAFVKRSDRKPPFWKKSLYRFGLGERQLFTFQSLKWCVLNK